jgi:hypothetical protein
VIVLLRQCFQEVPIGAEGCVTADLLGRKLFCLVDFLDEVNRNLRFRLKDEILRDEVVLPPILLFFGSVPRSHHCAWQVTPA